jgi:hypothetical protein
MKKLKINAHVITLPSYEVRPWFPEIEWKIGALGELYFVISRIIRKDNYILNI